VRGRAEKEQSGRESVIKEDYKLSSESLQIAFNISLGGGLQGENAGMLTTLLRVVSHVCLLSHF